MKSLLYGGMYNILKVIHFIHQSHFKLCANKKTFCPFCIFYSQLAHSHFAQVTIKHSDFDLLIGKAIYQQFKVTSAKRQCFDFPSFFNIKCN